MEPRTEKRYEELNEFENNHQNYEDYQEYLEYLRSQDEDFFPESFDDGLTDDNLYEEYF